MTALWILGILAVLLLLLCLTRVGVLVKFGEELTVTARLGFVRIQVLPAKKKPPQHEKKSKAKQAQKPEPDKPKKAFPKPALSDIRDAV